MIKGCKQMKVRFGIRTCTKEEEGKYGATGEHC